jgi:hypothetical protein
MVRAHQAVTLMVSLRYAPRTTPPARVAGALYEPLSNVTPLCKKHKVQHKDHSLSYEYLYNT